MTTVKSWGLGLLALTTIGTAGVAIGAWLFSPTTPSQLQPASGESVSPVTPKQIDDRRTVELSFEIGVPTPVRSSSEGLVTSLDCAPGSTLMSGESSLAVDGSPVVSLSTGIPLWRDLAKGDKGKDVVALQTEMARLGYDIFPDGEIGDYTLALVADLLGVRDDFRAIPASSFLWLPSPEATVSECKAAVGTMVQTGDELFVLDDAITSATIEDLPADTLPGPRTLTVDEQDIAVNEDGTITDQQALLDLQQSRSFQVWWANRDEAPPVRGQYALADPAQVYAVAPAAVYNLEGTSGCVLADSGPLPVTVISSELGQTLIAFDETPPLTVGTSLDQAPACR